MKIIISFNNILSHNLILVKQYLALKNIEVEYKLIKGKLVDYNIIAQDIVDKKFSKGIFFTEYGIDAFLVASKVKHCLVAPITDELTAARSVEHNNAKIAIFPLKIISINYAIELMDIFLKSKFEEGRHRVRISLLDSLS